MTTTQTSICQHQSQQEQNFAIEIQYTMKIIITLHLLNIFFKFVSAATFCGHSFLMKKYCLTNNTASFENNHSDNAEIYFYENDQKIQPTSDVTRKLYQAMIELKHTNKGCISEVTSSIAYMVQAPFIKDINIYVKSNGEKYEMIAYKEYNVKLSSTTNATIQVFIQNERKQFAGYAADNPCDRHVIQAIYCKTRYDCTYDCCMKSVKSAYDIKCCCPFIKPGLAKTTSDMSSGFKYTFTSSKPPSVCCTVSNDSRKECKMDKLNTMNVPKPTTISSLKHLFHKLMKIKDLRLQNGLTKKFQVLQDV